MSIKWTFMTTCTPSHTQHDWRSEFKRLEGAYAPATMKSYYADVSAFVAWCEANHQDPFPACVDTVCAFLEADAVEHVPNSVRRRLYAIRKIHQLLRLPDPTWDEEINLTFRRIRRRKTSRPKQAKGLTRDYLDRFLAAQPDTPWGLRNRAMLSLGYDLLTRRSELVALSTDDINPSSDGTLRVLIRRSKADQAGLGRIAFTSKRTGRLIADWLDWRGGGGRGGPLPPPPRAAPPPPPRPPDRGLARLAGARHRAALLPNLPGRRRRALAQRHYRQAPHQDCSAAGRARS